MERMIMRTMIESIAHIRKSDGIIQTVEQHLLEVMRLAEKIGSKLGIPHVTGLAGLLHDVGKYTQEFAEYIKQAVLDPDNPPQGRKVDHSTAGGKLLFHMYHQRAMQSPSAQFFNLLAEIVGNAVISHHSYLKDYYPPEPEKGFLHRVSVKEIKNFELTVEMFFEKVMSKPKFEQYVLQAVKELEQFIKSDNNQPYANIMFLTKYVFSALIEADRHNSRAFEEKISIEEQLSQGEHVQAKFRRYYDKLTAYLQQLELKQGESEQIYFLRKQLSEQCDIFALKQSEVYTLSIPTGGGKTLASLRYGLKHALEYGKEHIICIVPYTNIIEQNAAEVRNILKEHEAVLEHHCNVLLEDESEDGDEMEDGIMSASQKAKLAMENWDAPIIFTTMVQFLNVNYSKGTKNIRRLHQLAKSVIIFDEAQKVPVHCVSLFNRAVNFLNQACDSTIVLCTATQPALDSVKHPLIMQDKNEMVDKLQEVADAFKRVELVPQIDHELTTEELADKVHEQLEQVDSVLVILNTKAVVKKLYNSLKESIDEETCVYHLSTSMCARHRRSMLRIIRGKLKAKKKIVCVSTQLIEAGVNISFQTVIRSLAGLDSIAQAAGRCNRHGEHRSRYVYLIRHKEEKLDKLKEIKIGAQITERIIKEIDQDVKVYGGSLDSQEAMELYFKQFYQDMNKELDYEIKSSGHSIVNLLLDMGNSNPYYKAFMDRAEKGTPPPLMLTHNHLTAAERFHVIPDLTTSVLVPYGKGKEIITMLNGNQKIADLSKLLKQAQQYSINIYKQELSSLIQQQGIVSLLDGKVLALKDNMYSKQYGLALDGEGEMEFLGW